MNKPILLYSCEVWGFSNFQLLERVQLRFLKSIFNMKQSTPNVFLYGEFGVFPIEIDIQTRMISFWVKLIDEDSTKLSSMLYRFMYHEFNTETSKWLQTVKNILIKCGLSGFWDQQKVENPIWLVKTVKQKLKDLFIKDWYTRIENSQSCLNYKLYKSVFDLEYYLQKLPSTLKKMCMPLPHKKP